MSEHGLWHQGAQTPLPATAEDEADGPTLKREAVMLKQTPIPATAEDEAEDPTFKREAVLLKQTSIPAIPEDISNSPTLKISAFPKQTAFLLTPQDVSAPLELRRNHWAAFLHQLQHKKTQRTAVIALLLVLLASGTLGAIFILRQQATLAGVLGQGTFLASSKLLLGLCIILAIVFTVSFNIISRISLSTTRYEAAYTILWQLSCALLAPLFLPFDRFSINVSPRVLLLFALSVVLWALVDAFLFSAFKYEEASVLSAIFPLNFVCTFVVSVALFHAAIKATIIAGFLIIMLASLLIGVYHTRFRLSKGVVFGLLYSFFLGVALAFNSEVIKSFSIPPYMVAAFLFPAIVNLFVFLRPKGAELRYELKVQWKKILLNAAVMDASFFFLLKAFQLGNVAQVVALSASSTLLTALAGVVLLKEDKHTALKLFAAGLATLGLILVQL